MDAQVRRKLRGRRHRLVRNYLIMSAVVCNTDDASVRHRIARKVTHTLLRALAIEPAALQMRQDGSYRPRLGDGRHGTHFIVHMLGDIHGDVAAVSFGPSLFPEIAGSLCNLPYSSGKRRTVFQY